MTDFVLIAVYVFVAVMISFAVADKAAEAYLKMSLPAHLAPGSAVQINGTSTPSNSTHTHCMVDIIINNQSYAATNPTGKNGSFTTWNYLSGPVIHPGENRVTAKYSCFAPVTNASIPNFTYHHSMNITSP